MKAKTKLWALALLACVSARSESPPAPAPWAGSPLGGECQVEGSGVHPLLDRHGMLSRYEQLPPHCLKAIFLRCSAQANQQMMDFGSAAACSVAYEALLRRDFAGDFQALMAWWRTQRTDGSAIQ